MTMLLRPIAEVLAYTQSATASHHRPELPSDPEDEKLLAHYDPDQLGNVDFFLHRFAHIVAELTALSTENLLSVARSADDLRI